MLDVQTSQCASRPRPVVVRLLLVFVLFAALGPLLLVFDGLGLVELDAGPFRSSPERVVAEAAAPDLPLGVAELAGQNPAEPAAPAEDAPLARSYGGPAPPVRQPPLDALWPVRRTQQPFVEPADAAKRFAIDYLGFATPIVDRQERFDEDVSLVSVRATGDGPVTSVLVHRSAEDGSWWVLAASSDAVVVDGPVTGTSIRNPVHVAGTAQATAGIVTFELRLIARDRPVLVREFQTGGGVERQWFEGSFGWSDLEVGGQGAVVLSLPDPAGGGTLAATVVPVKISPDPIGP